MTTIKQWKSRLEEAAYFSQEDYENDKLHFMQAEIDELRAENERLSVHWEQERNVSDTMQAEIDEFRKENERLRTDAERYRWLRALKTNGYGAALVDLIDEFDRNIKAADKP